LDCQTVWFDVENVNSCIEGRTNDSQLSEAKLAVKRPEHSSDWNEDKLLHPCSFHIPEFQSKRAVSFAIN
jgi:hypothetical protein